MRDTIKLSEQNELPKPSVYALDGIGGSGKSHVAKLIGERLESQGIKVLQKKVAGLGNSPRVLQLKDIMAFRHELTLSGRLNEKQAVDKMRDRIFRLATRQQVKEFLRELEGMQSDGIALIDRTPMMSWVYASAKDPNNPYLQEILEDCLLLTEQIGVTRIFIIDANPVNAYARMIARYCIGLKDTEERILQACMAIGANANETEEIFRETLRLLAMSSNLQAKSFEGWDLIPIAVAQRERVLHFEAVDNLKRSYNIDYTIINGNQDIETVVNDVTNPILSSNFI